MVSYTKYLLASLLILFPSVVCAQVSRSDIDSLRNMARRMNIALPGDNTGNDKGRLMGRMHVQDSDMSYSSVEEAALDINRLLNEVTNEREQHKSNNESLSFRLSQLNRRNLKKDQAAQDAWSSMMNNDETTVNELLQLYEKFGDKPSYFVNGKEVDQPLLDRIRASELISTEVKVTNTVTGNPNGELWYQVSPGTAKRIHLDSYQMANPVVEGIVYNRNQSYGLPQRKDYDPSKLGYVERYNRVRGASLPEGNQQASNKQSSKKQVDSFKGNTSNKNEYGYPELPSAPKEAMSQSSVVRQPSSSYQTQSAWQAPSAQPVAPSTNVATNRVKQVEVIPTQTYPQPVVETKQPAVEKQPSVSNSNNYMVNRAPEEPKAQPVISQSYASGSSDNFTITRVVTPTITEEEAAANRVVQQAAQPATYQPSAPASEYNANYSQQQQQDSFIPPSFPVERMDNSIANKNAIKPEPKYKQTEQKSVQQRETLSPETSEPNWVTRHYERKEQERAQQINQVAQPQLQSQNIPEVSVYEAPVEPQAQPVVTPVPYQPEPQPVGAKSTEIEEFDNKEKTKTPKKSVRKIKERERERYED